MRYDDNDRESTNVEDRRGQGGGGFGFPTGGGRGIQIPIPMGGGRGGGFSFTTLLIIGAIMLMLGINPLDFIFGSNNPNMSQVPQMPRMDGGPRPSQRSPFEIPGQRTQPPSTRADAPARDRDDLATFTKRVLADTEDVWTRVFQQINRRYTAPTLVLFTGSTRSACGPGMSAMGPFYCPIDQKIYVDLSFYEELQRRFRAPGDFAQAYVIAHEVGHHVQTILGIAEKVQEMKANANQRVGNQIQVRMELQADCLAGVWAALNHQMKNRLQPGDVEEGLNAANAIGDDMIQKRTQGYVVPDAFTHGSAEQRVRWFRQGLDTGRIQSCDTFSAQNL